MKFNVYDFDGTIYDGDSGVDLLKFGFKKYPKYLLHIPKIFWYAICYKLFKTKTKIEFKEEVFSFFKYIDNMDEFIKEFWDTHECKMKKFWTDKKSHKNDIISSASGILWLKPIADKYKVYDLFGTIYDPKTGKIKGKNCHGEEKIKQFYKKYPKGIIEEGYTDSKADLPLMNEANNSYLVKKNKIYKYFEYKPNFLVRFWNWGWGIYHKNEEVWNYIIVGGLTTVVSIVSKWALLFTILDAKNALELQISVIASWILAVLFAYFANRIFVFKSKNKKLKEFITFVTSRIATLLMEMGIMGLFVTLLKLNTNTWVIIWTLVSQVVVMIANYIFSKLFVFKK